MLVPANINYRQRGFTLIEIMVVVAIIGTMVALLGVSISRDSDRLARLEAKRFQAIVNEVRDEAILAGESYFLKLDEDQASYRFEGVLADRVSSYDAGLLKPRMLENGVALRWEVDAQFEESESAGTDAKPKVLITALGEITPFVASFIGDEVTFEVFIDDAGQLARRDRQTTLF